MPIPLGATPDGHGTAFAVWSSVADRVELCLSDAEGHETRHAMTGPADSGVWQTYLEGIRAGQRYGYRVHGPWGPASDGALCDPNRLLLDPYARAIEGGFDWQPALFPSRSPGRGRKRGLAATDTAPFVPRSIVVDPTFHWGNDHPPARTLAETVIYEVHVKGLTQLHPGIPPELRGTYAGLAHPTAIAHLLSLGVTAVELLPVHHFVQDERLTRDGLRNYWGYNSIGFFAPYAGYATAASRSAGPEAPAAEFRAMVRALHAAGLEVILDVVYNHTGEGDGNGPILSFKGLDNAAYYRLVPGRDGRTTRNDDVTATGNTLDARHPVVTRLIVDSLRCWVEEFHVDGFRFDLAGALGRGDDGFDPRGPLLEAIRTDPVVSRVKLIAEPWDAGPGGYAAGRFPAPWSEWNDRFRDTARRLWRGTLPTPADVGYRLTASHDRYAATGRFPMASINYVTSHDGFTLADVVAYDRKHNEANGEAGRDGAGQEIAWNHGAEGPTDDAGVLAGRGRTQRNLLATLFLAQGVPMLLAGDEIGRTQRGNNNAYCQDNEVSWLDWAAADLPLMDFTRRLIALRRQHPALRRRHWVGEGPPHVADWFAHDGTPMTPGRWERGPVDGLLLRLGGETLADAAGRIYPADPLLLVFHACQDAHRVRLPEAPGRRAWRMILDTGSADPFPATGLALVPGHLATVDGRSVVVLQGVGVRGAR